MINKNNSEFLFVLTESTLLKHRNIYKNKTPYAYRVEHQTNALWYMISPSFNAEFQW
jgi:hypothetical protein